MPGKIQQGEENKFTSPAAGRACGPPRLPLHPNVRRRRTVESTQSTAEALPDHPGIQLQTYRIVPIDTGWEFKEEQGDRTLLTVSTKDAIIHQAAQYLEGKTGSVKIHTADGRTEEERTYPRGTDPVRSSG